MPRTGLCSDIVFSARAVYTHYLCQAQNYSIFSDPPGPCTLILSPCVCLGPSRNPLFSPCVLWYLCVVDLFSAIGSVHTCLRLCLILRDSDSVYLRWFTAFVWTLGRSMTLLCLTWAVPLPPWHAVCIPFWSVQAPCMYVCMSSYTYVC